MSVLTLRVSLGHPNQHWIVEKWPMRIGEWDFHAKLLPQTYRYICWLVCLTHSGLCFGTEWLCTAITLPITKEENLFFWRLYGAFSCVLHCLECTVKCSAPPHCTSTRMSVVPLVPLAQSLGAWLPLPNPSLVIPCPNPNCQTIWLCFAIQLARNPPKFSLRTEIGMQG